MNILKVSCDRAMSLRNSATVAEREMCRVLDQAKISFVFQSNVCDLKTGRMFIADFRVRTVMQKGGTHRKLFIEVDGGYHGQRAAYDQYRTEWLERHRNAVVIRFTNEEVVNNPSGVIEKILTFNPVRKTVRRSWTSRA